MTSLLTNFRQRSWLRALTWTAVTLVTALILLIAFANWYGARAWREATLVLQQEGVPLQFRETLLDAVPDAENFCAIPMLDGVTIVVDDDPEKGEPGAKRRRLLTLGLRDQTNKPDAKLPALAGASLGQATSMEEWAEYLRKIGLTDAASGEDALQTVRKVLASQDAFVKVMSTGLSRPEAQWTPAWKTQTLPSSLFDIAVPHLTSSHAISGGLALRSIASARAGDTAKAHEAALIATRFTEATLNEPFLIGLLVAMSQANNLSHVVWELGLAHAGSADDFRTLQMALAKIDFQKSALRGWNSELAASTQSLLDMKQARDVRYLEIVAGFDDGKIKRGAFFWLQVIPSGWFDLNAANLAMLQLKHTILPTRAEDWRSMLERAPELDRVLKDAKAHPFTQPGMIMASLFMPTIDKIPPKIAYTQCLLNQAIIACALEAYHAEHKTYPDDLTDLKLVGGAALPGDVVNKRPMSYRKTADGRYALWCAGFDGKDDGGVRGMDDATAKVDKNDPANKERLKNIKFQDPSYKGDWMWDFPGR